MRSIITFFAVVFFWYPIAICFADTASASNSSFPSSLDSFLAHPPIHTFMGDLPSPQGLYPAEVKAAYGLPNAGGSGTIAIISAFRHAGVEADLAAFDSAFSIASCTLKNKCLEVHPMTSSARVDSGWDMENALDTEWAHAIAPKAKILVIEAASDRGPDLMRAVDYAVSRKDVVAVSMSWGGDEFPSETKLDSHFAPTAANPKLAFFASSGDDGAGTSWPAVSPNVVSVGGTRLMVTKSTSKFGKAIFTVKSESAWSGSGGGVSLYESQPTYQSDYSIPRSNSKRTVPDVSYAADPVYGFSVYHRDKWSIVGGTSAGAPQWAAIHALGKNVTMAVLYRDKAAANSSNYFRDIVSGKNGSCTYFCAARQRYDYVTGLGSPVTWKF